MFLRKQSVSEKIHKELSKVRDSKIQMAGRLNKLSRAEGTGWADYFLLVEDYVNQLKKTKALTRLDTADDKTINQIKMIDREIMTCMFLLRIPAKFVMNVEIAVASLRKREEAERAKISERVEQEHSKGESNDDA